MNLIDIHSHILPAVDDGAKNTEESIELLKILKSQGVNHVVATPHFIPSEHNLEAYLSAVYEAKKELTAATQNLALPNIYIGSEVYYFAGIGKSASISQLTLNNSNFLLLELAMTRIDGDVLDDIINLYEILDLMPIIAHIERYSDQKGFKKLLKLVEDGVCLAQLNASSLFSPRLKRVSYKLIKKGYISFIATDTHSVRHRPPMLSRALSAIEENLGKSYSDKLIENLESLQKDITSPQEDFYA